MINERWDIELSKEIREENKIKEASLTANNLDEYVFVPLVNDVYYKYNGQTLTLIKNDIVIVKIKILDNNKHITKTKYNSDHEINIYNLVMLSEYAIDENTLGLVHTLHLSDRVKGILVNGKIITLLAGLSIQEFIFSKDEVRDKLFFIRQSKVELYNDIKISLVTRSKLVGKTRYHSLKNIDKEKMKGIIDLYGVHKEKDINRLLEKLSEEDYYSI